MPAELLEALQDAITLAPKYTGNDWRKAKGTEVGSPDDDGNEEEPFEPDCGEDAETDAGVEHDELEAA